MESLLQPSSRFRLKDQATPFSHRKNGPCGKQLGLLHSSGSQLCSLSSCKICLCPCKTHTNLGTDVCIVFGTFHSVHAGQIVKNQTLGSWILTWRRGDERISPTNIVERASSRLGPRCLPSESVYHILLALNFLGVYHIHTQLYIHLKKSEKQTQRKIASQMMQLQ